MHDIVQCRRSVAYTVVRTPSVRSRTPGALSLHASVSPTPRPYCDTKTLSQHETGHSMSRQRTLRNFSRQRFLCRDKKLLEFFRDRAHLSYAHACWSCAQVCACLVTLSRHYDCVATHGPTPSLVVRVHARLLCVLLRASRSYRARWCMPLRHPVATGKTLSRRRA